MRWLFIIFFMVAFSAPAQTKMTWMRSYCGPKFDTASGRLEPGTYADNPNGGVFVLAEDEGRDLRTLTKVNVIGSGCWHAFRDSQGQRHIEEITRMEYDDLAKENAGSPARLEP